MAYCDIVGSSSELVQNATVRRAKKVITAYLRNLGGTGIITAKLKYKDNQESDNEAR